jgi:hypothetical protein
VPLSRSVAALLISSAVHVAFVLAGVRIASAAHVPETTADEAPAADPWVGETFEIADSVSGPGSDPALAQQQQPVRALGASEPDPGPGVITTAAPAPSPPPQPSKHRRPRSKPVASGDAVQTNGSGSGGPASSGAFGMNGQPPGGPRDLGRAFTRAIPIAVSPDPIWAGMPIGPAGSFDLRVELGEDGRIVSARPVGSVSEHLRAIGVRTIGLLGSGTFAIKAEPGAGAQVLRISAEVTMAEGAPANDASQAGAYGLGYEPPWNDKPGKAWFTLRSGKHVDVTVRVMKAQ